jgi:hypothetical protein
MKRKELHRLRIECASLLQNLEYFQFLIRVLHRESRWFGKLAQPLLDKQQPLEEAAGGLKPRYATVCPRDSQSRDGEAMPLISSTVRF